MYNGSKLYVYNMLDNVSKGIGKNFSNNGLY